MNQCFLAIDMTIAFPQMDVHVKGGFDKKGTDKPIGFTHKDQISVGVRESQNLWFFDLREGKSKPIGHNNHRKPVIFQQAFQKNTFLDILRCSPYLDTYMSFCI